MKKEKGLGGENLSSGFWGNLVEKWWVFSCIYDSEAMGRVSITFIFIF